MIPKKLHGQILASTKRDLQDEELSREALERVIASYPERMPLHQRHDLSRDTIGSIENLRVEADPEALGHYVIKGDIEIKDGALDPDLSGFSISFLEKIQSNAESPLHYVFLPYPLYRDSELVQSFLDDDESVYVGKFVKKQVDPLLIGLIGTGIALALGPEWDIQYRQRVRPAILKVISWLPTLAQRNASADLAQHVIGKRGEEVQLILIPERGAEESCLSPERVERVMGSAKRFLDEDEKSQMVGVRRIKFLWDPASSAYKLAHVEYLDGSDCYHA